MSIQNSDFSNFKETLEAVQKSNEERKGFIHSIGLGKISVVAFKSGAFYEKELNLLGRVLHALGFIKETNAKHYKEEVQALYEKNIEQLPSSPKMSAFFKKVIGMTVPQKPAEQSLPSQTFESEKQRETTTELKHTVPEPKQSLAETSSSSQTSTYKTSLETSGSNETELEIEKESQEPLEAPKEESQSPKDETPLETSTDPKKAAPEPEKNPEDLLEIPQEIHKDESPTKNESVDVSKIKKETVTKPKEETVKAVKNFLIAFSLKTKKKKGSKVLFDLAQFKKINSMHDKSINNAYAKLNLNHIFIKKNQFAGLYKATLDYLINFDYYSQIDSLLKKAGEKQQPSYFQFIKSLTTDDKLRKEIGGREFETFFQTPISGRRKIDLMVRELAETIEKKKTDKIPMVGKLAEDNEKKKTDKIPHVITELKTTNEQTIKDLTTLETLLTSPLIKPVKDKNTSNNTDRERLANELLETLSGIKKAYEELQVVFNDLEKAYKKDPDGFLQAF